jgi:hypothetical protein
MWMITWRVFFARPYHLGLVVQVGVHALDIQVVVAHVDIESNV